MLLVLLVVLHNIFKIFFCFVHTQVLHLLFTHTAQLLMNCVTSCQCNRMLLGLPVNGRSVNGARTTEDI